MKWEHKNYALPVLSWCGEIEEGARIQIEHLASHGRLFHHVAVMPDCHQGYGMPIGGVIAAHGVIIPNAVGVDIGCGMCAVSTDISDWNESQIKNILSLVRARIPLGFEHHKSAQEKSLMPESDASGMSIVSREYTNALRQIGTLGGGNHFIEFQKDPKGFLCIMIHSGSRNIGKQVAEYYNHKADEYNAQRGFEIPKNWQLSYLEENSPDGESYINEMNYCVQFALANRKLMMQRIMDSVTDVFHSASFGRMINIAHNYAAHETHFGKHVWIHRKGATLADNGTEGIIPGSQGTPSYIVRGKGNPASFNSCSHGAGRRMGRKEAERRLDLAGEQKMLEEKGIIHSIRSRRDLDEASGAYKDIRDVMQSQSDLVDIVTELLPVAVIKG